MDCYRFPLDYKKRREELLRLPMRPGRKSAAPAKAKPIHIGNNVWIGFEACVLPGVTVGDGSVIGARSVVIEDVPHYTIVAGNPARPVRQLKQEEAV